MSSLASIFLWALHQVETFAKFCEGGGIPGVAQAAVALAKALNVLQSDSSTRSSAPLTTPTTVTTVMGSNCTTGKNHLAHLLASNPKEKAKPDPFSPSAPSDRSNVGLIRITGDFERRIKEFESRSNGRCVVSDAPTTMTTPTTVTTATGSDCTIGKDRLAHLPAFNPEEKAKPDPSRSNGLIRITGDFERRINESQSRFDARCVVPERY